MYAEPETAIAVLKRLHALGVKVSIDDFGTGFSSLSYLARFPRDTLKLDRSFIAQTTRDNDVAAVVGSVILMAHELGVQTVAEGVETEEHLDFLLEHDCDLSQGYLHSPPLPPEEAERWLRAHGAQETRRGRGTARTLRTRSSCTESMPEARPTATASSITCTRTATATTTATAITTATRTGTGSSTSRRWAWPTRRRTATASPPRTDPSTPAAS